MQNRVFGGAVLWAASFLIPWVPAQTEWQRLPLLPHHRHAASTFDQARSRIVLFGGVSPAARIGETWEWDGAEWRCAMPASSPSPRESAAAVFDPVRGVVVLFGGRSDSGYEADTWQWNGTDWTQRAPAVSPPARSEHAMTWDGGRQRLLLFGGRNTSRLDDTWEWNGANWNQRSPQHSPPPLAGTALAFDPVRDRVVLFGGTCDSFGGPCYTWATWEWDGSDWTDMALPWHLSPEPRAYHAMVFDSGRSRVVVYGGSDEPAHYKGDTWEWDGSVWTERSTVHRPIDRLGHGMVYDPAAQRALAFGGETWVGMVADLWALDASDWQLVDRGQQPNAGYYVSSRASDATWDGDRRGVVWFGIGVVDGLTEETWLLANERWTLVNRGQGPHWPSEHRLQWLPTAQRTFLHLPRAYNVREQTWAFDGAAWTQLYPAHLPQVYEGFDLALDPRGDRIVLFGGRNGSTALSDETWWFDGADWTRATPATSPPARQGHAMALDAPRGRVVLYGGRTAAGPVADTWEWDGNLWHLRSPANTPGPRAEHRMVFDRGRRRTILHGGGLTYQSDTWEWDGVDWTQRSTTASLPSTYGQVLAYDVDAGATFHIGTTGDGTWRYGAVAPARFDEFGNGCGGSLGPPSMRPLLEQRPHVGVDFELALEGLPGPFAFGAFGFSNTTLFGIVPLPHGLGALGYPACELLVQTDFVVVLATTNGRGHWVIAVPAEPGLVGLEFYSQVLAFDPTGSVGLAMTRGGAGRVGGL